MFSPQAITLRENTMKELDIHAKFVQPKVHLRVHFFSFYLRFPTADIADFAQQLI